MPLVGDVGNGVGIEADNTVIMLITFTPRGWGVGALWRLQKFKQ